MTVYIERKTCGSVTEVLLYFDLGTTPNVFVKHGAKKVDMIMYEDVDAKVTGMKGDNAHTISLGEIAKLPSQLNDPIFCSKAAFPVVLSL